MIRDLLISLTLVLLTGAAIVLRLPDLLIEPRFWAEEGRVYFAYALTVQPAEALFAVHQGYYSLLPNLATWLATRVPLEQAPAMTTVIAIVVQAVPALIVATSSAIWFAEPGRKALAVLIVLLVGAAGELHATTIAAQFHLAVATAIIYLEFSTEPRRARGAVLLLVLVIAGLTGVQSLMLAPFFAWRWWRDGRYGDGFATLILGLCVVVQIFVIMGNPGEADRFAPGEPLLPVLLNALEGLAKGLLVYPIAGDLGPGTRTLPHGDGILLVGGLGVAAGVIAQLLLLRRGPGRDLLAAAWFIAIVSFIGSRRMAGGDRYLEVSSILIVLALMALAFDNRRRQATRLCAGFAVLVALAMNAWLYQPRMASVHAPDWPSWSEEIAAWRDGQREEPRLHPQWADGAWTVVLPERLR